MKYLNEDDSPRASSTSSKPITSSTATSSLLSVLKESEKIVWKKEFSKG